MNIILIGPPASGKGTQAKFLEKQFNLYHLSTGDLLREMANGSSDLSKQIKSLIDNGQFVSDELIIQVVKNKIEELKQNDANLGILFDGFPRTVFQAKSLESMTNIDYIIEIAVSKQEIVKRVLDRAVCKTCGKSFLLSQTSGLKCDNCGGDIVKRNDDRKEIAESRYDEYMLKTYPILEYFKNHNGYHKIDGENTMDLIFNQICKILSSEKI